MLKVIGIVLAFWSNSIDVKACFLKTKGTIGFMLEVERMP